jgi:thiol-disulfide isomerase/thioredoxin
MTRRGPDRGRRHGRVGALVAVLGLVLVACGTDEPAATEPVPSSGEEATAVEEDVEPSTTGEEGTAPSDETGDGDAASTPEDPAAEEPADEQAAPDDGVAAGERADVPDALAFTAPAVGGGEVEGADAAGHPVALWFWAPWCPTCNREAPEAARLAHEYGDVVRFIGVAGLDDMTEMEAFVETHDVGHFPHAATEDGELWVRFGVSSQPAWIVLDADGEVVLSGIRPSLDAVRDALDEVS